MKCTFRKTFWTEAEREVIRTLYPDSLTADLMPMLPGRSASMIYNTAHSMGLKKSTVFFASDKARRIQGGVAPGAIRNQFTKGHRPFNKGKKGAEYISEASKAKMARTQFAKGTVPPNHKPVGYERISKDGYIEVKTGEGMQQFRAKHHIIWEQHFGPIPKGNIVVFKNRDPLNVSPDNLECITRAENMKRNTYHNWPKELATTVQLRGALNRKINNRIKQLTNEK